jgi:hypothetical protein
LSLVRLCGGRPAVSGTGVGVAVVTHPAALLAIMPGPGTPAGETVPPPVTIFRTQTQSRLLTTYTAHALNTSSLQYDNLAAQGPYSHAARKRLLAGQRNVGKQPSRHTRHAYQLPSTCPSPT